MSVVKISGLDTVLTASIIKEGMGFGVPDRTGWIGIFRGLVPGRNDLIGKVTEFRTTDLLWSSFMPTESLAAFSYQTGEPDFILPVASGHASWFMYAGVDDLDQTAHACLIGDVSLPGDGGDLALSGLDFIVGNKYRVHYLQIAFPYSFTY